MCDSNHNHNNDRSKLVLYRVQTFNFSVSSSDPKQMTTQCCRVVVVDDVLGSKNKTNVPLYFSMLNHNGLLPLSKHTMNGPIQWATGGGTELAVNQGPAWGQRLVINSNFTLMLAEMSGHSPQVMLFNSTVCALQHGTCVITHHYTLMGRPSVMSITIITPFQMLCH